MTRIQKLLFILGFCFIIGAGLIVTIVSYLNSSQRATPVVFSNKEMLLETWNAYKKDTIDPNSGRTLDKSQHDLTTSEGESYTMLRAVWMDDKQTFDKSWQFTKNNLQRTDHLFSWKYGKLADGSYGVLASQGGHNTATDADQDIALALTMAYTRWNQGSYLADAKPIITSIWQNEVVMVAGKPVVTADNQEQYSQDSVVVNPSYFAFANYKVFARLDPAHDWNELSDHAYTLLDELSSSSLGAKSSSGLPPNWITLNRTTGALIPNATSTLNTDFGYDAIRIPFRLALDYAWYHDGRDKDSLSRYGFLDQFWKNVHVLNSIYAHDGTVVSRYESPAMYGATIGYFMVMDPPSASDIYRMKLQTLYSPDQQSWKAPAPGYYEDNWAWFGMALYHHALPNLTIQGN